MIKTNEYINEINRAIKDNNANLSELLSKVTENKDFKYDVPCLYVEWLKGDGEDPLESPCLLYCHNLNSLLKLLDENTVNRISEILNNHSEKEHKRQLTRKIVFDLIATLESTGNKVVAAVRPTEWFNAFFVYKDQEDMLSHYLLHHFMEAKETASGMFNEYWSDFDKSFNDFLKDNFAYANDNSDENAEVNIGRRDKLQYFLEEDLILGKTFCRHNLEILNLDEVFFETAKKGFMAAKKYC